MLWALEAHDPDAWLKPEQGSEAEMLALINACDGGFKFALDRYKYPERYTDFDPLVQRATGAAFLMQLEQGLQNSAYLFGSRPALADMAIAPFVRQFAHTDKEWFAAQAWPKLQAWLNAILDSEIYALAMTRYAPWQEGQAITYFPSGK
jgi:glutathione S-transferase